MERASSKHGPRLDEEMAHEVHATLQGGLDPGVEDPELPGEDQPDPSRTPSGYERAGAPPGMTPADVAQRSRLGRYIPLSALPGDRDALIVAAEQSQAPQDIIDQLAKLPTGQRYETVSQVWAALGGPNEARRT